MCLRGAGRGLPEGRSSLSALMSASNAVLDGMASPPDDVLDFFMAGGTPLVLKVVGGTSGAGGRGGSQLGTPFILMDDDRRFLFLGSRDNCNGDVTSASSS